METISRTLGHLSLGATQRALNLSMTPLVAESEGEPRYVTLDDAIAHGWVSVTEVTDGGSVPTLLVRNVATLPVLILDGEELVGAKQNRIVNLTILVPPQATLTIPVSCVEAGRWSATSAEFSAATRTQHVTARARKARDVTASLNAAGERHANQDAIWNDIAAKSARLGVHSPTSAAAEMYERFDDQLGRFESGLEPVERQVGAVFGINGAVAGLDLFDAGATWLKVMPKLIRGYGLDAIDLARAGRPDAEPHVRSFLDVVGSARWTEFPAAGLGQDLRLESEALSGGALLLEGRVVHLMAFASLGASSPSPWAGRRSRRHETRE